MPDAIIVSAARTAIGTAFKGTLTETTPEQLTGTVLVENVNRSGLDPQLIDDVRCRVVGHTVPKACWSTRPSNRDIHRSAVAPGPPTPPGAADPRTDRWQGRAETECGLTS
jgi:hypothetical protein